MSVIRFLLCIPGKNPVSAPVYSKYEFIWLFWFQETLLKFCISHHVKRVCMFFLKVQLSRAYVANKALLSNIGAWVCVCVLLSIGCVCSDCRCSRCWCRCVWWRKPGRETSQLWLSLIDTVQWTAGSVPTTASWLFAPSTSPPCDFDLLLTVCETDGEITCLSSRIVIVYGCQLSAVLGYLLQKVTSYSY